MRKLLGIVWLSIACGCTGTRTGNPGNNDDKGFEPLAVVVAQSELERDLAPAPPKVTLTFNRPFMFLIYDEPTGQILFVGNVAEP